MPSKQRVCRCNKESRLGCFYVFAFQHCFRFILCDCFACMCVCAPCTCLMPDACSGQQRAKFPDSLKRKLLMVMSHHPMLGTKPMPSARATSALTCRVISPAPSFCSLSVPAWPQTFCVAKDDLELLILLQGPRVLGFQVCATTPV